MDKQFISLNLDALGDFGNLDKLLSDNGIVISNGHGDPESEDGIPLVDEDQEIESNHTPPEPTLPISTPFDNKVIVPEIKSVNGLDNCFICCNPLFMKVTLPCRHEFCFGCIKGQIIRLSRNQSATCPLCNQQISSNFTDKIKKNPNTLANIDVSKSHIINQKSYWFYSGRNNGWWSFDIPSTNSLEILYQKHKKGEDISQLNKLSICGMTRIIDLDQMIQKNEYGGSTRRIIRVTESKIQKFMERHKVKGMSGYSMNYLNKISK